MTVLRDGFMMKRVSLLLVLVAQWGLSCCLAVAQDAVPVGTDLSKMPLPPSTRRCKRRKPPAGRKAGHCRLCQCRGVRQFSDPGPHRSGTGTAVPGTKPGETASLGHAPALPTVCRAALGDFADGGLTWKIHQTCPPLGPVRDIGYGSTARGRRNRDLDVQYHRAAARDRSARHHRLPPLSGRGQGARRQVSGHQPGAVPTLLPDGHETRGKRHAPGLRLRAVQISRRPREDHGCFSDQQRRGADMDLPLPHPQ